jgi:TetR/AcrR family transcriptional regulator, mexJK operon transcriptional repressor
MQQKNSDLPALASSPRKLMSVQDPKPQARGRTRRAARAPGRIETAEQRRERIVRVAAPLFLKHGYDNVSIDDIIDVVGGSKATIYAWFGGKEGLFEAVITHECRSVTMAIHVDETGSLEAQLTEIGQSFLAMVLSPPILEFHRLMVSIGRKFPEIGRLFYQTGPHSAYSIVASWIAKQQQAGRVSNEDPYRLAVLFLDMLIGEHQLSRLTSMPRAARREQIDETVRLAVKVFLGGCAESAEGRTAN